MLKMDLEYDKGVFCIRLNGSLNKKSSYKINNYIIPIIKKHHLQKVIFNFENLNTLDNSGINALINAKCATRCNKGHIYFCGVKNNIELSLKHLHIKMELTEGDILKLIKV